VDHRLVSVEPHRVHLAPADAIRVAGPHGAHARRLEVSERAAAGVWYQGPATSTIRVDPIYQSTVASTIRASIRLIEPVQNGRALACQ